MAYYSVYKSPIGRLYLIEQDGFLTGIGFSEDDIQKAICQETMLLQKTKKQLEEYFKGKRKAFDLPLAPKGTLFMQKVWQALQDIAYGEVASYQDIAKKAGNIKACRAVGMANNRNPISIVIPCHRVIGKNGTLVGYGGGLSIKEFLLKLEKENKNA